MLDLHHVGSRDSVAWVVGRLKEMAVHAYAHPAKPVARDRVCANDPSGSIRLRFSCTGRMAWLSGAVYRSWDTQWRIRIVHRRSSSPAFVLDCVLPRKGLSAMSRDLGSALMEAVLHLSSATIHDDVPSGDGPDAMHSVTGHACMIRPDVAGVWFHAASPYTRPRMFVRDQKGDRIAIGLTGEGRRVATEAGCRMVLRIESGNIYAFDTAYWAKTDIPRDAVGIMRSVATNPTPLCH